MSTLYSVGQMNQLADALEGAGYTQDDVTKLRSSPQLGEFKEVLSGSARIIMCIFHLASAVARDMTGWTCLEPVPAEKGEFKPELHEFLRGDEASLVGETMITRAKEQGSLTGLRHAEAMLRQAENIPVKWRKYTLVFPEVWQSPNRYRVAWYLDWSDSEWYLDYLCLDVDFDSNCRLVASRKCQKKPLGA